MIGPVSSIDRLLGPVEIASDSCSNVMALPRVSIIMTDKKRGDYVDAAPG